MSKKIKASEVVDWKYRDYIFNPVDGGLKGRVMAWGKIPTDGTVLGLGEDGKTAYRVTGYEPGHAAADYDGFFVLVEFVPGRDIEVDQ